MYLRQFKPRFRRPGGSRPNRFWIFGAIFLIGLLCIERSSPLTSEKEVSLEEKSEDPHFRAKKCNVCHPKGIPPKLEFKHIDDLCSSCHQQEKIRTEIHPSQITSHRKAVQKIPKDFPLISGKMTCNTCHDTFVQCKGDASKQEKNPLFLRGGPYLVPWDICFRCHDSSLYDVFDPHDQIDDHGKRREETCLYCHEPPDHLGSPEAVVGKPSIDICRSCHWVNYHPATGISQMPKFRGILNLSDSPKNHPDAGARHMQRKPSPKMRTYIKNIEKKNRTYIPLNTRREVYCSTCHNPHEKGVFLEDDPRALGSEGDHPQKNRIRISSGQLCVVCHDISRYGGDPGLLYR